MTNQKKMPKINPLKSEREMSDFTNFLANQNFSTIEEANEFLQKTDPKVLSRLAKRKTKTKDDEAFDLVASACDESPEKGLKMVKKALEIDPDCADAERRPSQPDFIIQTAETGIIPELRSSVLVICLRERQFRFLPLWQPLKRQKKYRQTHLARKTISFKI